MTQTQRPPAPRPADEAELLRLYVGMPASDQARSLATAQVLHILRGRNTPLNHRYARALATE